MRKISKKQQKRLRDRQPVISLLMKRCVGCCDICGRSNDWFGIHPHHIIKLSQGGKDDLYNLLAGCSEHHDHAKYGSGMPISQAEQIQLAKRLTDEFLEVNDERD